MVVIDPEEKENQLSPLDGALSGVFLSSKMDATAFVCFSVCLSLRSPNSKS